MEEIKINVSPKVWFLFFGLALLFLQSSWVLAEPLEALGQ